MGSVMGWSVAVFVTFHDNMQADRVNNLIERLIWTTEPLRKLPPLL